MSEIGRTSPRSAAARSSGRRCLASGRGTKTPERPGAERKSPHGGKKKSHHGQHARH
ncbi:protein of unknown function [Methylorubrum extorquens]|uniref:Uncharacterized protein n=1 Tax=Methylorubrum extorquens TaxID=408 RepID=A0A2N9AKS3_METEX|nr:protein of unknown function [Methylorubrum extorquens]